jgi:hypothetical protein
LFSFMPWNDWYHIMTHTYGTWLPGDPKGFSDSASSGTC